MIDLLQKFCHETKEELLTPFNMGDYTYTSDGWIALRVKKINGFDGGEGYPHIERLRWNHHDLSDWSNPPSIELGDLDECRQCKGYGRVQECPECSGEGIVYLANAFNEYENDCATCRTDGEVYTNSEDGNICDRCNGKGKEIFKALPWGEGHINALNVVRLSVLPGLKISKVGDGLEPWCFIFDGGEGIVIPMRVSQ